MRAIVKLGLFVSIRSVYLKIRNDPQKKGCEPSTLRTFTAQDNSATFKDNPAEIFGSLLRPLVLCGPSGSGKSTFIKRLMEQYKDIFGFSISHTTRSPRDGELNGREYHFVSREQFMEAVYNNEFMEWMEFSGNLYGTSWGSVSSCQGKGKICLLDIDMQGVKQIKTTNLNPRLVFIKPSSWQVLKERLSNRGTETETSLEKRLSTAKAEMEFGEEPGNFHLVITNDDFEKAWRQLDEFLKEEITEIQRIRELNGV